MSVSWNKLLCVKLQAQNTKYNSRILLTLKLPIPYALPLLPKTLLIPGTNQHLNFCIICKLVSLEFVFNPSPL